MSTYTQILYQIVFSTKYRKPTLNKAIRSDLFAYISGILQQKGCRVYQVGGVADHIHIITHLHPSTALADLVKAIKLASGQWLRAHPGCPSFTSW
ncbi:MAG: IS200/IS605 family transposase [Bacteroidota bacterium]